MPDEPASQTTPARPLLDVVAEALWQAEALRASDRLRWTEWSAEGADTREQWRFMAHAALVAAMTGTKHVRSLALEQAAAAVRKMAQDRNRSDVNAIKAAAAILELTDAE